MPAFWILAAADLGGGQAEGVEGGRQGGVADRGPGGAGADPQALGRAGDAGELAERGDVENAAGEFCRGGCGIEVGAAGEHRARRLGENREGGGEGFGAIVEHAVRRWGTRGARPGRSFVCKLVCGLPSDLSTSWATPGAQGVPGGAAMATTDVTYLLDEQAGFLLRRVNQRHLAVFSGVIPEVTTTQFAALARLAEMGPMSQNQLGRATSMDAATIKGVVGRLVARRLVVTAPSAEDRRRLIVDLTAEGRALFGELRARGVEATERTLAPLSSAERARFLEMLRRLI